MDALKEKVIPPKTIADSARLMRLLILVDKFERDVREIREEFGTIKNEKPEANWMDRVMDIHAWFVKRGRPIFTYMSHEPSIKFDGSDPYYQAITKTGKKFNLPPDFYCDARSGISAFVLTDWITVSSRDWNIVRDSVMSFSEFLLLQKRHGLAPLVELEELKSELREFLGENGIVASFLEDKTIWFSFRNGLGRVLAEQPLDFGDKPIGNLRVKEIRFLDTNPKISCAFLISMKDIDDKELGPFLFADDDPSASF